MSAPRSAMWRVDETAFLAACGESSHTWADRLGTTNAALRRLLDRYGRPDLARPLRRLEKQEHRARRREASR